MLCVFRPQDVGEKLTKITPRGMVAVFETLRSVLHSKQVNSRVQYMIEVMFAVRKDKFQVHTYTIEGCISLSSFKCSIVIQLICMTYGAENQCAIL